MVEQFINIYLYISNEHLIWIGNKVNVKDISMSNTSELYDKRSTKCSELSFRETVSVVRATMMEGTNKQYDEE